MTDFTYIESIESWRKEREKNLALPHGWLATAGLFWLQPGENRMGTDSSNPIRLPVGAAPANAAIFTLDAGNVSLKTAPGVKIILGGQPITETEIPIGDDSSEAIDLNDLKIFVLRRGERLGVRVFNPDNPNRLQFDGLDWFSVDQAYCLQAQFIPFQERKSVEIVNLLGDIEPMECPGIVEFEFRGELFRLEPVVREDGRFWFMFCDRTNGVQTYKAGRYLFCDPPKDGLFTLDFNRAQNPPCAFTEFATCPLPPVNNRLPIEILAGERKYSGPKG
jgi:uncharacterized protein (DUF1684 family)